MSARRRTRAQDAAKPPKIVSPAAAGSDATENQQQSARTNCGERKRPRGMLGAVLGSVKYILLLVIMPPFLNYAALQREGEQLRPTEGELYDVGWGRKMYLMCSGKGPPTVVLDAPTGMTSDVWSLVWPRLQEHTRVCVYDRAGLGFSERPTHNVSHPPSPDANDDFAQHAKAQPFTVESMAEDLHRLVRASSDQPSPFIMVGAELGGVVSQFYTLLFDRDVLGVVLVNPLPETLFEDDRDTWSPYWFGQLVPTYQSLQMAAALGLTRVGLLMGVLKQPLPPSLLPPTIVNRQNYLMCHPKHLSSVVDEHHFINDTFSQMKTLRMMRAFPSNVSVTVMTGNYYDEQLPSALNKAWAKAQQSLITRAFPGAQHIVVNGADRHMPLTSPDAIVEQVLKMVRHWRQRQPVTAAHK
ncbi:hypothetical protein ACOMHN_057833 [Nucella lapillus]